MLALAALALVVPIAPASAHSVLTDTSPSEGEELDSAPEEVSLTFNEDLVDLGTEIVVAGPDGEDVASGDTEITGPVASRALAADLPAGEYEVTWRVTSADGHPISGTFAFTVSGGGDEPAETSEPTTEPTTEAAPTPTSDATDGTETTTDPTRDGSSSTIGWLLAGGGLVIVLVVGAVVYFGRRNRRSS